MDTYDAHLLLAGLRTGIIEVKAGETIAVQVTASLTAEQKAALNEAYPNGTYVEGYTFAEADGDCDVTHSIPVLGFYGNWSDPSMFGISYTDSLYGVSRKPYVGAAQNNDLVVNRGGELQILTGRRQLSRREGRDPGQRPAGQLPPDAFAERQRYAAVHHRCRRQGTVRF